MQGYVAIYGGSFDPPHKGHSEIIRTLCENVLYTHIILMPNFKNPLKTPPLFAPLQRLQMCEKIAKEYNAQYPPLSSSSLASLPRVSVNDYEIRQNRAVYSVESVREIQNELKAKYADMCRDMKYAFVLGSDSFNQLARWHNPQELCEMVDFVVVHRVDLESSSESTLESSSCVDSKKSGDMKKRASAVQNADSESAAYSSLALHSHFAPHVIENLHLQDFSALSSSAVRTLLHSGDINSALMMMPPCIHSIIKAYFRL